LVTRGVSEPYRMFTSRAEYRLQLREDNADLRLTEVGRRLGSVDDVRWEAFCRQRDAVARELERLKSTRVDPRQLEQADAERVLGRAPAMRSPLPQWPSRWRLRPNTLAISSARTRRSVGVRPKRPSACLPRSITVACGGFRSRSSRSSMSIGRRPWGRRRAFQG